MVATIYSTITMSLKAFISLALYKAGVALRNQLKRSLQKKPISPSVVEDYRLLWLRWSKLVSQEGKEARCNCDPHSAPTNLVNACKRLFQITCSARCTRSRSSRCCSSW
ncbi:hypothetical protein C0J52_21704 [Blattella germanica]|nr:hypothetical protein C0J52_21704 [Blattella germanica]